jgi:hypothetical protein
MVDVQFEEETPFMARPKPAKKLSLFTRIVMKLGLAKDEAGAQRVLLIAALVIFAFAAAVFINLIWFL